MVINEIDLIQHAVIVTSDPFAELRGQLAGQLLTPGSDAYNEARRTIYINLDRHPLAIVRAANAQDVAAAVNFARSRALPLAVRSGGHSLAHLSVVDGALVVDLSTMKRVEIDPEPRIGRVQAGATSGDLAGPANALGLALTTGDTHSVGMGGLVTGGGIGFMVRKYGLAIDNLLEAQVVTASGEIVTASETEHADLFWAIRGGGGNVGIVTEFTFRLAPVNEVLGGALVLPATREVIRGYLEYSASAPDDLTTIANVMYAPPAPFIPEERMGELVLVIFLVWTGSIEDGQRAVAPLRALAEPVADAVSPMPYPVIYNFTAFALIQFRGLGGALARVGQDATAFAHRDRRYFVAIINIWLDAAEDAATHEAWTRSLWSILRPEGSGVYVNFLENEGVDRIREAYPEATYNRLAGVKRRYDPGNLFRFNQNVTPQA
jgi:FAD/FMN-containing dehydrogenase